MYNKFLIFTPIHYNNNHKISIKADQSRSVCPILKEVDSD
jgi:hypothetical protein